METGLEGGLEGDLDGVELVRSCLMEELQELRLQMEAIDEKVNCLLLDRLQLHLEASVGHSS